MASRPITSWQIDGETVETVTDCIFLGGGGASEITADGDCSCEIKRHLLLGRKVMTKLDSIFKSWFWTLVLEKTLENPLDCKEIQPVHPKGDQSWVFIGRTDVEADTLATWCKEWTHLKRPWCWERLKAGGEGDDRGWDGWMASSTQWVNSGSQWWTGGETWHAVVHGVTKRWTDWVNELNWTTKVADINMFLSILTSCWKKHNIGINILKTQSIK